MCVRVCVGRYAAGNLALAHNGNLSNVPPLPTLHLALTLSTYVPLPMSWISWMMVLLRQGGCELTALRGGVCHTLLQGLCGHTFN